MTAYEITDPEGLSWFSPDYLERVEAYADRLRALGNYCEALTESLEGGCYDPRRRHPEGFVAELLEDAEGLREYLHEIVKASLALAQVLDAGLQDMEAFTLGLLED